jgi:hypothetical protein
MGLVIEGEPNHNGQISGPSVRRMQAARVLLCASQSPLETNDFPYCTTEVFSTFVLIKTQELSTKKYRRHVVIIHEQNYCLTTETRCLFCIS